MMPATDISTAAVVVPGEEPPPLPVLGRTTAVSTWLTGVGLGGAIVGATVAVGAFVGVEV
jgi:hypothetical protein